MMNEIPHKQILIFDGEPFSVSATYIYWLLLLLFHKEANALQVYTSKRRNGVKIYFSTNREIKMKRVRKEDKVYANKEMKMKNA